MRQFMSSRQYDAAAPTRVVAAGSIPKGNEDQHGDRPAGLGHELMQLQRRYGNRHVQGVVNRGRALDHTFVPRSGMALGAANDTYEREADDVARQVRRQVPELSRAMSQPASSSETMTQAAGTQRLHGTEGGAVDVGVQVGVQQAIHHARGRGQAIPESVRVPLERAFGADFSEVRLHTDTQADQLSHSLRTRAFTTGQDIFFRRGQYNPEHPAGQEVIAHELTHVVQQRCAAPTGIIQRHNKITEHDADDKVPHQIEVLHRAFKHTYANTRGAEEGYQLGNFLRTPQDDPTKTITKTPKRAKKVVAKLDGVRSGGVRQNDPTQTEYGHLGEYERAIFGRNTTNPTYQGGHLVPDSILGTLSYEQENFAPQLRHANSPDYRVIEELARLGPVNDFDKTAKSRRKKWTMTVELSYDPDYRIPVANLAKQGIILPGITVTDSGHTEVRFPRRVPHTWKVKLKAPDGYKFPKTEVTGESQLSRFQGTAMDNELRNAPLTRKQSQLTSWGIDSAQRDSDTEQVYIGGGAKERFSAIQSLPMLPSKQPHCILGGGTNLGPVGLPLAQFKPVLTKPIELVDLMEERIDYGEVGQDFIENFGATAGETLAKDLYSRLRHFTTNVLYDPKSTRLEELLKGSPTRKIVLINTLMKQRGLRRRTVRPLSRKGKLMLQRLSRDLNLTLDYPRLEASVKRNRDLYQASLPKPKKTIVKKKH